MAKLSSLPKESATEDKELTVGSDSSLKEAGVTFQTSTDAYPSQSSEDGGVVTPGIGFEKRDNGPSLSHTRQGVEHHEQLFDGLENHLDDQHLPSGAGLRPGDSVIEIPDRGSVLPREATIYAGPHLDATTPISHSHSKRRYSIRKSLRRSQGPVEITETISRTLEHAPNGYPRLATFLDSNDGLMAFRRFGNLQTRLLLEKQSILTQLEKDIDELDWDIFAENPEILSCIGLEDSVSNKTLAESIRKRRELLIKAETSFKDYAALMTAAQQMRCFEPPTEGDYWSIRQYLHNFKPLISADIDSFKVKHDLVALRPPKEPDYLEHKIIRFFDALGNLCQHVFGMKQRPFTRILGDKPSSLQVPSSSVTSIATFIVAFVMAVLLVGPILICYVLVFNVGGSKGYNGCIGVTFLFTLMFSCAMAFYSKAKRHEVLAATAAYCAVLVVFLGNAAAK